MSNGSPAEHRARVLQAQGMVSVQASCTIEAALVVMQERATATDTTLEQVAALVLSHQVSFAPRTTN